MFTGIVEQQGKIIAKKSHHGAESLVISSSLDNLQLGESIAVNGVCLTLLTTDANQLTFDVSPETLKVTTLAELAEDDYVNLEQAMPGTTRFGGHYVSGHVDAIAYIDSVQTLADYVEMKIAGFNKDALLYLVPKGSITIDGVSLTINAVEKNTISCMLVPHTLRTTTLGRIKKDQKVNIEFDYLTRIVAHQLQIAGKLNYEVAS